jgi:hypothetical protein
MHSTTRKEHKAGRIDLKALAGGDQDFLRELIRRTVQEVLEAEMTDALGAAKSERTAGRNGYRSGYYGRSLITRVGKLELRVPQDRAVVCVKFSKNWSWVCGPREAAGAERSPWRELSAAPAAGLGSLPHD